MKKILFVILVGIMGNCTQLSPIDPFSQTSMQYADVLHSATKNACPAGAEFRQAINNSYQALKAHVHTLPFSKRVAIGYMIQMPIVVLVGLLL